MFKKLLLLIAVLSIGGYSDASTSPTLELVAIDETSATYRILVEGQRAGYLREFPDGTTVTRLLRNYWAEQIPEWRMSSGKSTEGPRVPVDGSTTVSESVIYWYDRWENTTAPVGTARTSSAFRIGPNGGGGS